MTGSDSLSAGWPLALSLTGDGALASALTEEGLSSSTSDCPCIPRPLRRRVLDACASQLFGASVAFARRVGARLPLGPPLGGILLTTRQTSLDAADYRFASLPF